jgi:viroplasmin and RNaseH domain-containing protein
VSVLLNNFIYENNITSILDLGCGDLTWVSKTDFFKDSKIEYTGSDIVEFLINQHKVTYPDKIFLNKDVVKWNLDKCYNLIIIRDVIFHLKNDEILSIFANIKNKFKYIAITSCTNNINTDNFNQWKFSEKNLHIEPFNIPKDNHSKKCYEHVFNRNFYIYEHNSFFGI